MVNFPDFPWLDKPRDVSDTINPDDYITSYDNLASNQEHRKEQYRRAYDAGKRGDIIFIARNSVWSAQGAITDKQRAMGIASSYTSTCERLGYHSCTAELLRGWRDSGARIYDYRPVCPTGGHTIGMHNGSCVTCSQFRQIW